MKEIVTLEYIFCDITFYILHKPSTKGNIMPNNMNEITMTINDKPVIYVPKDTVNTNLKTGPEVIIRTYSAGVHVGVLKEKNGSEITLTNARRIWKWNGAFTLNAVAKNGVDRKESRISVHVPEITLLDAVEILPVCEGVDLTTTEK
jgi:hypothetical protein